MIIAADRQGMFSVVESMQAHLRINASPMSSTPLFSYRGQRDGRLNLLTKERFMARCRSIWAMAPQLPPVSGHCFRIGGTTALLLDGCKERSVMRSGRWRSEAWMVYVRDRDIIIAQDIDQRLPPVERVSPTWGAIRPLLAPRGLQMNRPRQPSGHAMGQDALFPLRRAPRAPVRVLSFDSSSEASSLEFSD